MKLGLQISSSLVCSSRSVLKYRKLSHPNIISLMGYSFSEDEIVLITNYVEGSNLDKILFGKEALQV